MYTAGSCGGQLDLQPAVGAYTDSVVNRQNALKLLHLLLQSLPHPRQCLRLYRSHRLCRILARRVGLIDCLLEFDQG